MLPAVEHEDLSRRDWDTGVEGTVRFAVVGLGGFARNVAIPATEDSDYCETSVVVSGSAEKAERIGAAHDARPLTYEQFHDGAAVEDYDAVYVCTPNALHLEYVETAAELGKDVFCEKPLEATAERARRLRDACADAGVALMTAYRMQFEPLTRRLREWIREGALGTPLYVRGNLEIRADPDGWRLDPELAGGGAAMDIGIYPLNTARFVLDAEPTAITATTSTPRDQPTDEHIGFQLTFPDDVVAHGQASFDSEPRTEFEVVGTEASVHYAPAFNVARERTLRVWSGGTVTETTDLWGDEMVEEFDYFAHCALTGTSPAPDGDEGVRDLEILEAAYESARTGEPVDL